ncbi:NAD(P)-dependent alcohol dehydrogenase [Sphingobium terrigena]|uniref:NAD(P)-dependent alcohol dehydrogenase n=1 Tax=Sphingobium terrigena TaxID=2304063 RepID=A0A418YIB9_9SPHN|nr:NAD(P)-dependent alcohol dehydrogenase [Sphingobium terrigena]MDI1294278.1 NAD(P)-dependent alcohol dehydrogenase [bacterium]RJG50395.1 NAD(P)-dependent alcohol dehydrogenase [Sphingobium terrigena]
MEAYAAIIERKGGEFVLDAIDIEEPRDNEVLVKIAAAGMCHTDLTVRDQYYPTPLPAVLGHEGSGIVEKVGRGVTTVKAGDKVVLSFSYCGTCPSCMKGHQAYCPSLFPLNFMGRRLDGSTPIRRNGEELNACFFGQSSFATYSIANENNCVKVAESAQIELLGPLGCGIQTGAGAVLNALQPAPGSSIAIFGVGSVGLSAVMAAKASGCLKIIAVDRNPTRLQLARELGATDVVDATSTNAQEAIIARTNGGADYAIDTTAIPQVLRSAVDSTHTMGETAVVGGAALGTEFTLDMNNMLFGRKLRGVVEGSSTPQVFIPQLIAMREAGLFPFERLCTFYDFDQINQAVEDTEKTGNAIKAILKM